MLEAFDGRTVDGIKDRVLFMRPAKIHHNIVAPVILSQSSCFEGRNTPLGVEGSGASPYLSMPLPLTSGKVRPFRTIHISLVLPHPHYFFTSSSYLTLLTFWQLAFL
jgi:hypothetical protein